MNKNNQIQDLDTLLAPAAISINARELQIADFFTRTIALVAYPRYLNAGWLSSIINMDSPMDISLFIHPEDTGAILKKLRDRLTRLESQAIDDQASGKVRDPVLETAINDIEALRDKLQLGTDRFFRFAVYISIYGKDLKELDKTENQIKGILDAQLILYKQTTFRMKEGFLSSIPLSADKLDINTSLNTEPISSAFPFVSLDLTSNKGILYGINTNNNSLVIFDRFSLQNANSVVLGQAGGGKSYATKLEIMRSLMFGTQIFVIDPENEYRYLAEAVGGTIVNISIGSDSHINPFDLPKPLADETPTAAFRSHNLELLGLLEVMLGQITEEERALLDEAIAQTYAIKDINETSDFDNVEVPVMSDLQTVLSGMTGADSLVNRLRRYTEGSFSGFINSRTNIELGDQLVVFDLRDMQDQLKPLAMFMVLNHVWTQIRTTLKKRILVVDEAWLLLKNSAGGEFLFSMAKRARKYFLGLTVISQEVSDLIDSPSGKPILDNSSIRLLFNQKDTAIEEIKKAFNLTDSEKFFLLEAPAGQGLFFAGSSHIALRVVASYSEDQVVSSDPRHLLEIEEAKKELAG